MRAVEILQEKPSSPEQHFIALAKANPLCAHCNFDIFDRPNRVFLAWIEGRGTVKYLTQLADECRVVLCLIVEIYSAKDGGKLIGHYKKFGFDIEQSDFDDDFDFDNADGGSDLSDLKGTVTMFRNPV
jgi:hypothetical protein